ncbi:MAG: adenylosuccinate synthase [Flavobacteriales bacterium CG_4_9_14_0_2_um_filter_35_242]|nr:adenylosuccinate synthase [Zetaproteobacteria bacterium]OIO09280.1 MAG: adenylosuccinate synthase [Flavobacteriaceae bacterium CG1_02_35_72]PIV15899.1 MAG: adenylosuccinate synthase [Flavobacteriales bacterium CG03_land_8_20_14_0_80_35_15]PIX07215.1 MAG: adenylosuccinate synthase [Flavobacteriales bacterium CG_4_8_14_3_um_filter_35_10]PJA05575.1 MAG: adenylosuccinate synthase [Flavobacteriales bacterium CG_4_10_14_0_2_um_filter_35_18]PJC60363.1 MAG: adenylosuccinate synthase [Flavobacterial
MKVDLLLGLQWGDEGKGKIVDVLTKNYSTVARFQGGPNAGHTLIFENQKHVLHTIPSGIFHKGSKNIVGNGVVIDPVILKKELENLDQHHINYKESLFISRKAHLILPTHRLLDAASEATKGKLKIGSTLKGIGPTYMDKTGRNGMRVGDLELDNWKELFDNLTQKHLSMLAYFNVDLAYNLDELVAEYFDALAVLRGLKFIDSEDYLFKALKNNQTILAEGAQGSMLDIDFGTYPYVTSSNTTAAGACTGLGISPHDIGEVFGIIKAYTTRVGSGPFPTELFDDDGKTMGRVGCEFGATTGRPRRCGWLDLVALKYAVQINGATQLMMMKADVLSGFKTIKACTSYIYKGKMVDHLPYSINNEDVSPVYTEFKGWEADLTSMTSAAQLPENLLNYIKFIENFVGVKITIVSVGPDRLQTIMR